jgi:alkylation response protein AidB-like acyl-CoA dehydrogenase
MQFTFSDEQRELRDGAREYLRDALPLERVAEIADSERGWDPTSWAELAELGWLGATVPEDQGGAGLGFVEQAILLEELGYSLYAGPYLATVLALPALGPEQQAAVAEGETRWSVEVAGLVPELDRVDRVVTAEGAAAAEGETLVGIDPTRPLGKLRAGAREPLPGTIDAAHVLTALAAEALGVAEHALELAVEYAKERQQFGKPIGIYQAIAHPLADSFADIELARSLAYAAAWKLGEEPGDAPRAAAAAKAFATEAAVASCQRAIQVFGGIGFTWEHPIHRFYKRALWLQAFGGYPAEHRATVAASLLGGPSTRVEGS